MRNPLFVIALAILFAPYSVMAHDIGVSRADLTEMEGHAYQLSVQVSPALAHFFPAPLLPDHCAFTGNPRGAQGADWRSFKFACEEGLTAADSLELPWRRDGVMLTVKWQDGAEAKQLFSNEAGVIRVSLSELKAGSGSWIDGAKRYTLLGIEHILAGIDHLLFVLALLFVVGGGWRLVKTITAFTVAHSITLGLATLGYINMSSAPVEAAIALSIVFLCVEIIHAQQGRPGITFRYPWIVAFAFGSLHGLGFAGALSDIGLPSLEIPLALLFFNIGVELGQLMFVFAVLAVLGLLRYGAGITRESATFLKAERAMVYVIGVLASYWLIERSLGIFPPLA